ncbi:MAG: GntR family transcriptional regulator [Spirochaetota bacterium]|jgi:GntR family transcriptional regulator|nr:GntR family transcriptional regulator [Spirochaetota bacterium]
MKKLGTKRPLYTYVQEEILKLIRGWDHTKPLPSEMDLSRQMGVSRATVREAIQNLEKSDILFKRHGVGTFINQKGVSVVTALNNLHGIQNIVRSMGKEPSFKEQVIETVVPDGEVCIALGAEEGTRMIKVSQVYLADDVEIIKGISYVNPVLYSGEPESFMEKIRAHGEQGHSLFTVIDEETSTGVDHTVARIEAVEASPDLSKALDLEESQPIIRLKETHYNAEGLAILFSMDYIDTNRFELLVVRKRSF